MPDQPTAEQVLEALRSEAVHLVLVYHHHRDNIERCACGWSELGKSHARHVQELIVAEVEAAIAG